MSFPKYPKYKDSGFQWLGDIPSHWETMRLATVCDFQSGKAHEPFIQDVGEFICVNSRFVSTEGESRKFCTENLSPTKRADILMVMSDLPNGRALAKAFFVDSHEPYAVNQRVCIIRAQEKANARFLYFQLNRSPLFLRHDDGVNQTHLSNATFTKFPTLVPPLPEQHAIATFLDAETSKIDALIAEQRRLIELLKEKRQAVISHAVTKGLNPDAPMKPSGIEWLGDVPEHWEVSRIKHQCDVKGRIGFRGYTTADQVNEGEGALTLGATHINAVGEIILDAPVYLSWEKYHESPEIMVEPTNIVVVQRGSTCGKVGYVEGNHGPATINPSLVLLKGFHCAPKVVFYYLSSSLVQALLACELGKTAIPMLSQEQIGNIAFCVPPADEQTGIVVFIANRTAQTDELLAEATRAIDLLQERRTALISAAVTGKIDVRDMSRGGAENAEKTK